VLLAASALTVLVIIAQPSAARVAPCGGVSQQAEHGLLSGDFVARDGSGTSSGRDYVLVPDGSPRRNDLDFVEFCVTVPANGVYRLDAAVRAASSSADSFWVQFDRGPKALFDTGIRPAWSSVPVSARDIASPAYWGLSKGDHRLRFYERENGTHLDSFRLVRTGGTPTSLTGATPAPAPTATPRPTATPAPAPSGGLNAVPSASGQRPFVPITIPGRVEAEHYDLGGSGIAWSDTARSNAGGQLRSDGVDLYDVGGTTAIGNTAAGEWVEFTVDATHTGKYEISVRAASGATAPGGIAVSVDGRFVAVANVANLGWSEWQTITLPASRIMSAGQHLVRLSMVNGPQLYVDSVDFRIPSGGAQIDLDASSTVRVPIGTNLRDLAQSKPENTTFILASGVHTGAARIEPKNGQRFVGDAGAVLDGRGVSSPAFAGEARDVEVWTLEIRNYRPGRNNAAISARDLKTLADGRDWVVADNFIHDNSGAGVNLGTGMRVAGNRIEANEQIGISGLGSTARPIRAAEILDNVITANGIAPSFAFEYHEGGIKATYAYDLVVRGNRINDNGGVGLHCDLFCRRMIAEQNELRRNAGRLQAGGIFYELSDGGRISNNVIADMAGFTSTTFGAIVIAESRDVAIDDNQIQVASAGGIMFRNRIGLVDRAGNIGRPAVADVRFRRNLVTSTGGDTRIGFIGGTTPASGAVRFEDNTYRHGSGHIRLTWNGERSWSDWQALGFDRAGALR